MKKKLIILLMILSACCAIRKTKTSQPMNQNSLVSTIKKFDTVTSSSQSKSYVPIKDYRRDTLGYIQYNFIDNKKKYIGKDLNSLLTDVEFPVKSYLYGHSMRKFNLMEYITLQFYSSAEARKRVNLSQKPVNIIITWLHPIPMDSANILLFKNKGEWTEDEHKYFGKQKIGDIITTDWSL